MNGQQWLARVRDAFRDEWQGATPTVDIEAELARARGREVARLAHDRGMLTALRLVHARQARTLAVDARDLATIAAVIEELAARCPEQDDERTAP